ncbi:MAG: tRNA (guanine10-N2)-dimethyltransferase [Saprospiraceae bacterium]|jgi:tRNA (guanine10-N2)-dimethyltransferase
MHTTKHIYSFTYDNTERELCKLESRYIFNTEEKNRLIFSDISTEPSNSAFIKSRLDLVAYSEDYETLISEIKKDSICCEGFKVEYLIFGGDKTVYADRLDKLRDVGYSIEGTPDYYKPTTTFALCCYESVWYFGVLIKNNVDWHKHNNKPCSYSNSISINIAKALVNIAAKGNNKTKLLDACCGVGTIMLEACFAGFKIEGCEINWKICRNARENLAHFNYSANVYRSDIKDIRKRYDAAIIDLPYNLVSCATESDVLHIIESAAQITDRLVIVSTSDIANFITKIGFRISDHCSVSKRGKRKFARRIWVCEKRLE